MKRLRLMAVRSRKEELLRELTKLGCVEFSEIGEEMQDSGLRRESSELMAIRNQQSSLEHAIELLDKYAPVKSKLLSAKPEVKQQVFLEEAGVEEALALAGKLAELDDGVRRLTAEESRQRGVIEALRPWTALDLPLAVDGTERTAVVLGTIPGKISFDSAAAALTDAVAEAELFPVNRDKSAHYALLVCMKEELPAAQEALRSFGFTAAALSGLSGTPKEEIAAAEAALNAMAEEKASLAEQIAAESGHRDELKLAHDKVSTKAAMAEAEDHLYGTDSVVVMEGWMPAEREAELAQVFERFDCAWDSRDPEAEEYPDVPVKLKNNRVTNSLNMVTNMYSLPAYGTVDPNPLMAPFFILFYGLMMADMGYGLIMIAAALVAMKKIKPREGSLAFCQLLLYCGISTFICGALTGGLFGDAPYRIVHMINPNSTWEGLPLLFSPIRNSETVLYGSMVLGLIQLYAGMVVSFVQKAKAGNLADGIFEEGSLWVILVGGILLALPALGLVSIPSIIGKVILILGLVMLLFGAGRHAKGFGKVTAAIACIYNTATGWFGDILSYSRIMALMLAGGVVAQVFNTIGAMPAESSGVNPFTIFIFILIFLVGHALNFALNILGCFVHDLRLQCLEFFGKFFSDGGRPFAPLKIKSKYVVPEEH